MINFYVFAAVSFAISGSLALYMVVQFIGWMISIFQTVDEDEKIRPARR